MRPGKILLRCAALCASLTTAEIAHAASLDVHITNLRPTETVHVTVFKDALTWAEKREPVATRVVAARDVSQTVRIDDLPPGRYAVRVHQDPNPGGICEPPSFAVARHGSSRSISSFGMPASFDRAAIEIGDDGADVSIRLFKSSRFLKE